MILKHYNNVAWVGVSFLLLGVFLICDRWGPTFIAITAGLVVLVCFGYIFAKLK